MIGRLRAAFRRRLKAWAWSLVREEVELEAQRCAGAALSTSMGLLAPIKTAAERALVLNAQSCDLLLLAHEAAAERDQAICGYVGARLGDRLKGEPPVVPLVVVKH